MTDVKGSTEDPIGNSLSIAVFGDSHSVIYQFITLPDKKIDVTYLGPWTMNRIGRDGVPDKIFDSKIKPDILMAVFGEIDIRCHILKQADTLKQTTQAVIDKLVDEFFTALLKAASKYKVKIIIRGVVPPTDVKENPEFPIYGTLQQRVLATKALNAKLAEMASKTGMHFLDVYTEFATEDGTLRKDFSDSNVHIDVEQRAKIATALQNCCKVL